MKELIKQTIERFKAKQQILQDEIKEYVQNKLLPLSDRWEIFCLAGNEDLIPTSGWIVYYNSVEIEQYLADRERYSNIYLGYVVEFFEERVEENKMKQEELENFKEEILETFIWSFELDW